MDKKELPLHHPMRAHMETPKEYSKRMLDKTVEEVRKKGYLDLSLKLRVGVAFDRTIFMEELCGALVLAVEISKAYQKKYGKYG